MRIRRFLISICIAIAFGTAFYFAAGATIAQGTERGAHGLAALIGTVVDFGAALSGESPALRAPLPPVVTGYDWSAVAVLCGLIAVLALYFSLHQLAALYDERA